MDELAESRRISKHWTFKEALEAEEERERQCQEQCARRLNFRVMDGWKRLWILSIRKEG